MTVTAYGFFNEARIIPFMYALSIEKEGEVGAARA